MRVLLDPGHGGSDPGAVNPGPSPSPTGDLHEADFALFIAEDLRDELEARGHEAMLTREGDVTLTGAERVRMSNMSGADLMLCIHLNAGPAAAHGFEVIYDDARPDCRHFAEAMVEAFEAAFPDHHIRGVKTDAETPRVHLYVLEHTKIPTVLVEVCFISNASEMDWLLENIGPVARALADGLEAYASEAL